MAIKVDLHKAFNRLNWEFIADTLADARLPPNLSRIILSCFATSSMRVQWNGQLNDGFHPMRGIHQGDPLSPYLFQPYNGASWACD
ncbi:hypothetical protein V6N11_018860 [Hibiscus sabdariffa]|uniref:Reverse transcriptase domain-containing protein n=1 Tax=Hibiscus sabdariffa TaxID=183260 RepID=A0ABR2N6C0_9ROSI